MDKDIRTYRKESRMNHTLAKIKEQGNTRKREMQVDVCISAKGVKWWHVNKGMDVLESRADRV